MSIKNQRSSSNLNDVLIVLINKGQFVPLLIFVALIVLIYRLPDEDIKAIFIEVIHGFHDYHLLGWILAILTSTVGVLVNVYLRSNYSKEMNRVSLEKSKLQGLQIRPSLGSSNKFKKKH